jgi:hypothetical protein
MSTPRWTPSTTVSARERMLLKRLVRTKKLFAFLRLHRHELFNETFQAELAHMYRDSGEGKSPVTPALLAMVVLLQAYTKTSDAEAVELSIVDARWQMVLDIAGSDEPTFSQGALQAFRQRLIAHNLDRRLLERTVELAKQTGIFDWKKLPKDLRLAVDSRPIEGAGRVEDTLNLLAHAARNLIMCIARILAREPDDIARAARATLLTASSIKKALDLEWSDPEQKNSAVVSLVEQLDNLQAWIEQNLGQQTAQPPLREHLETLRQLRGQDLEPDPGDGKPRIRRGVAEDRRVSVTDSQMRHGRKSDSKLFNGYKGHIAADLDLGLVLACAVTPANRPESDAAPELQQDIAHYTTRNTIAELYIDRGYISSALVPSVLERGGEVLCKPWFQPNGKLFAKRDFKINLRSRTITCPAGEVESFKLGEDVEFDAGACSRCSLRGRCTSASIHSGRSVYIARDEPLQHRLRRLIATRRGRARLRERVPVEHRLAHLARKQGKRARYRGVRSNLFDLRRHAAVLNLEALQRLQEFANAA